MIIVQCSNNSFYCNSFNYNFICEITTILLFYPSKIHITGNISRYIRELFTANWTVTWKISRKMINRRFGRKRRSSRVGNFLSRYYCRSASCRQHSQTPLLYPDASQAPSGSQGWPSFVYPLGVSPHLPGEHLPRTHLRAFATSCTHLQFSRFRFCVISLFAHVANSRRFGD